MCADVSSAIMIFIQRNNTNILPVYIPIITCFVYSIRHATNNFLHCLNGIIKFMM